MDMTYNNTLFSLTGAVHHHLIETRQRMKVGIILETAEAREVHHMCVLLGKNYILHYSL